MIYRMQFSLQLHLYSTLLRGDMTCMIQGRSLVYINLVILKYEILVHSLLMLKSKYSLLICSVFIQLISINLFHGSSMKSYDKYSHAHI